MLARGIDYDKLFVVTDSNVKNLILDKVTEVGELVRELSPSDIIVFPAGEENKNIHTVCDIWQQLSEKGATRKSLIINIGGGVTTDMGGFAASTFKRGIRYVNIPTTLLAMVDASVGGKTGIDFAGLKNEIGTFAQPLDTLVYPSVLKTLPQQEILSGMGEVVKMAMLRSREEYLSLLRDFAPTEHLIDLCIKWKKEITDEDPLEKGLRKLLNFGHTAGHAFESVLTERNTQGISHGMCVAHGIAVALILSHLILKMPSAIIHEYKAYILSNYPTLPLGCKDMEAVIEKMRHDKKNSDGEMRFVLLRDIAHPKYDVPVTPTDLSSALDIYLNV